ncbi:N-formylglutamate amidohydrolase [Rhodovulum sp. DZ06]|uniref:N-formylglutamate amidohydrolase n=1 Tax=Rhodovulum sp. DZ06 TaxID=3425126 RepID=UPI003D331927
MPSMPAYEIANEDGDPALLLLCDHASNAVPREVNGGDLGLPPEDMARHIAYDVGARGLTLKLAQRLNAPAALSTFSRLVIDPNRGEDDPTLVMRLYDGSVIPANRHATGQEVAARLGAWHRPYHGAIRTMITRAQERLEGASYASPRPAIISIHSYTPQLKNRPPRPWHAGVLWDEDARIAGPLIELLRDEPGLVVGDNEPYTGHLQGDTMWEHGTKRGLPHALIEVRNDLIADDAGQERWADILARAIPAAIARMEDAAAAGAPAA